MPTGAGNDRPAAALPHGKLADPGWPQPELAVASDEESRPGYTKITAAEYVDTPEVLAAKVKLVARMIRGAEHLVAYTGAGISTASGVADYASKAEGSLALAGPKVRSPWHAQPTRAHRVLVELHKRGWLERWIQQNHDGLPQKAGLPQHAINEIHGAWWDPSNPVVKMAGSLREDLFAELLACEKAVDVCLAIGTSLSGMNADRVPAAAATAASKKLSRLARRHLTDASWSASPDEIASVGGLVIVGFQRTQLDHDASVRIYAEIDRFATMLATELAIDVARPAAGGSDWYKPDVPADQLAASVFKVRYGSDGARLPADAEDETLDLSEGAKVKITGGPYVGSVAEITTRHREGHFELRVEIDMTKHRPKSSGTSGNDPAKPFKAMVPMKLGLWWVQAAVHGDVDKIPVAQHVESEDNGGEVAAM